MKLPSDESGSPPAAAHHKSPASTQDSASSPADPLSASTHPASSHKQDTSPSSSRDTSAPSTQDSASPPTQTASTSRYKRIPSRPLLVVIAFVFCAILARGVIVMAAALSDDRVSQLLGEVSTEPLPEVSAYLDEGREEWRVSTPRGVTANGPNGHTILTTAGPASILEERLYDTDYSTPDRIVQFNSDGELMWSRTINVPVYGLHNRAYMSAVSYSAVNGSLQAESSYLAIHTDCTDWLDGTKSTPVVVLDVETGESVLETKVNGAVFSMVVLSDAVVVQTTDGTSAKASGTVTVLPFDGGETISWESDEWLVSKAGNDLVLSSIYPTEYMYDSRTGLLDFWLYRETVLVRTVHSDGSDARGPWRDVVSIDADGELTTFSADGERAIIDARTAQREVEQ
ncbi:hypothetical protein [Actinobaculum sp. 352]|uniref:hypothetical protein n=1 Tax=Actinobaculum sp. 352 TaxID=2490946 RepID=UPI000F904E3E|nr:hypothetical protein [Actinobaculum sp. 352]RTE49195.1 hypothetical protein EKN07_06355 [Actinobaculum sp. 352]